MDAISNLEAELEDSRVDASDTAGQLREALGKLAAAEQRDRATREVLERIKRTCYKHFNGDENCKCAEIDAALAGTSPVAR